MAKPGSVATRPNEGNALAVLEPLLGAGGGLPFFLADLFVFHRRGG